ncbi:ankyrin repeat domain-containing protein [Motilimonas pumila]|uniref:Ankyrin repeat domain-containing protein n=1 Tax=Motilimonas pumila TaxID=2303987 RepID=A0A418Y971_9GAMM|nr:ankyrin repeat domain-containing protein [Motilimonas pumila]RJG36510.1 ankyrin repeat domain-containing protein [Motilimonas pumila]
MSEIKYEIGHRYGERESMSKESVLSNIDSLFNELSNEIYSQPDDEHREVYIMDNDRDSFTVNIDGYVLIESKMSGSMVMYFKEVKSLSELRVDALGFLSDKLSLIKKNDWVKDSSLLSLRKPSFFRKNNLPADGVLHEASYQGELDKVKELIAAGANIDFQDSDGATPIMQAIVEGHEDVVLFLIQQGAALELTDNDGCDVFELAESFDRISLLLQNAAKT